MTSGRSAMTLFAIIAWRRARHNQAGPSRRPLAYHDRRRRGDTSYLFPPRLCAASRSWTPGGAAADEAINLPPTPVSLLAGKICKSRAFFPTHCISPRPGTFLISLRWRDLRATNPRLGCSGTRGARLKAENPPNFVICCLTLVVGLSQVKSARLFE